eukprot:Transcript_24145.p1 GENE.Transcript_24145~~Transcript_24145.p1  ORF type:complete len:600 (+),score=49.63 Transcript_24145:152-1951(+)
MKACAIPDLYIAWLCEPFSAYTSEESNSRAITACQSAQFPDLCHPSAGAGATPPRHGVCAHAGVEDKPLSEAHAPDMYTSQRIVRANGYKLRSHQQASSKPTKSSSKPMTWTEGAILHVNPPDHADAETMPWLTVASLISAAAGFLPGRSGGALKTWRLVVACLTLSGVGGVAASEIAPLSHGRRLSTSVSSTSELVSAVNDNAIDRIVVQSGLYELPSDMCSETDQTSYVTGSALCISRALTIEAEVTGSVVLDAKDERRLFTIDSGGTLDLIGLNITKGRSGGHAGGGAIVINSGGVANLNTCNLYDNYCFTDPGGGAILVHSGGEANLNTCTLHNNEGGTSAGALCIKSGGVSNLNSCNFIDNESPYGGAIRVFGEANLVDCNITGSVGMFGGAIFVARGHATLIRSFVYQNQINRDFSRGGGIFIADIAKVTLIDTRVYDNTALGGADKGPNIQVDSSTSAGWQLALIGYKYHDYTGITNFSNVVELEYSPPPPAPPAPPPGAPIEGQTIQGCGPGTVLDASMQCQISCDDAGRRLDTEAECCSCAARAAPAAMVDARQTLALFLAQSPTLAARMDAELHAQLELLLLFPQPAPA